MSGSSKQRKGSFREKEAEDRVFQGEKSRGQDLSGREAEDKIKIDKQIKSKIFLYVCCTHVVQGF
jgi:hypothetical protein